MASTGVLGDCMAPSPPLAAIWATCSLCTVGKVSSFFVTLSFLICEMGLLVCLGCSDKVPHVWRLKQQKSIFS